MRGLSRTAEEAFFLADSVTVRDLLLSAEAAIEDALVAMDLSRRGDRQPIAEIADAHSLVQRWRLELEAGRWPGQSAGSQLTHRVDPDSEDTR